MIDAAWVIVRGLRAALPEADIRLDRDATYTPDQVVTVVQTPTVRPAGDLPGRRLASEVRVVLTTTGPDFTACADAAEAVADAVLSLTEVDGVKLSSVRTDSDPVRLSPHDPTGAETMASTHSLMMRKR